jgi:hypothetical protein
MGIMGAEFTVFANGQAIGRGELKPEGKRQAFILKDEPQEIIFAYYSGICEYALEKQEAIIEKGLSSAVRGILKDYGCDIPPGLPTHIERGLVESFLTIMGLEMEVTPKTDLRTSERTYNIILRIPEKVYCQQEVKIKPFVVNG